MDAERKEVPPGFPEPLNISKVIAPIKYKRNIVRAAEEIGQIEPLEVDPRTGADTLQAEERRNTFEDLRNKLQSYLSELNQDLIITSDTQMTVGKSEEAALAFVTDVVKNKAAEIDRILKRKAEIESRSNELTSILDLLDKFQRLEIEDSSVLQDSALVKTFVGTVFPGQLQRIYWAIDEITQSRYFILDRQVDKENSIVLISVLRDDEKPVETKLNTLNFQHVELPEDTGLDGLSAADCNRELEELRQEDAELDGQLDELARQQGHDLVAALEVANIELQRIEVEMKMRRTESTCVMWSWIAPEIMDEFKTKMHKATEGSATVDFRKGDFDPEFTPSNVKNSEFMEPMRGLVTSFGTPGREEVDPYPFVKYLFPILFGIMFADVGHGILLMLAGLFFYQKKKKMIQIPDGIMGYVYGGAELMIIMGFTAALIGIPFNSVFGDETLLWHIPPIRAVFEPVWRILFHVDHGEIEGRNYISLLVLSFAVGAIVILMGLGLNLYQLYFYRHSNAEWFAAWTLAGTYVFAVGAFIGGVFNPILMYALVAAAVLCLVGTLVIEFIGHGIDGVMLGVDHILSLMSNTFSFGRLLAMNTIHFVLALLPYLFLDMVPEFHGVLNHYVDKHWVPPELFGIWIFAAFIGSLIVVPVETTFSTLQSLRLNWVEFFGKFYKGEGVEFKPLKVSRIYTAESK